MGPGLQEIKAKHNRRGVLPRSSGETEGSFMIISLFNGNACLEENITGGGNGASEGWGDDFRHGGREKPL